MEDGENGVIGLNVLCLAEEPIKREREYVTVLLHNLEVTTARPMDLLIPKLKDATKIPVQVKRLVKFFKDDLIKKIELFLNSIA